MLRPIVVGKYSQVRSCSLFAASDDFLALVAAPALIGLGIAAALTAGLKALVMWFLF
jgi:hypothetical protein